MEETSDIVAVFKPAPMPMRRGRYFKNSFSLFKGKRIRRDCAQVRCGHFGSGSNG